MVAAEDMTGVNGNKVFACRSSRRDPAAPGKIRASPGAGGQESSFAGLARPLLIHS
jgi:hypothetical protein